LRRDSIVFCEEISTIDRTFFRRGPWGERVTADVMDQVIRAVRRALGDVVPEGDLAAQPPG
jgi:mRNA-degrading endonuclease toxin of MazEF toxin-antitoxin module